MAYTPTTWVTGDTITANALNKIENGIANAGSGWDAIIRLAHANNSNADNAASITLSIVEGSFSDLYAKITNDEYPMILVEYYHPWGYRFAMPMAYITYANGVVITMQIAGFSVISNTFIRYGEVEWTSVDVLAWA